MSFEEMKNGSIITNLHTILNIHLIVPEVYDIVEGGLSKEKKRESIDPTPCLVVLDQSLTPSFPIKRQNYFDPERHKSRIKILHSELRKFWVSQSTHQRGVRIFITSNSRQEI